MKSENKTRQREREREREKEREKFVNAWLLSLNVAHQALLAPIHFLST